MSALPNTVALVIDRYQALLDQQAPQLVTGLYLHGSIALDAFCDGLSDIDFVAVLSRAANSKDIDALERVHAHVAREYPRCLMEGSYLQWRDLGRARESIAPYPCYHDGRMHRAAQHDISPVTWWLLKQHGVAVRGPQPTALDFEITWPEVAAYMVTNLNTYWAMYARRLARRVYQLPDKGVEWAVLGVCRLLYGIQQGTMISKARAGSYALEHVDEEWRPLIREALFVRTGIGERSYRYHSRFKRASDTAAFVKYVITGWGRPAS